jgi:hypothetical protein
MAFVVAAAISLLLVELYLRRRPWAIVLSALLALIATVIWIFSADQSRQQQNAVSAVEVTVAADSNLCVDPTQPIATTLTNNGDQTANRLSFDIIGREPGKSKVAYRGTLRHVRALFPGETVIRCDQLLYHGFAHPRPEVIDATKYEWTAHVTLVGFGDPPPE